MVSYSSLFSHAESDYLDYVLNNKKFDNSMAIRNTYQHGMPIYDDESIYSDDYYAILLILIMYMNKFYDQLLYKFHVMKVE
ncbi:hypothetical protein R55227_BLOPHJLP_00901 [Fructobacillus tropaeoli]|nr:hypothetical protein R55227_BLOPHJLP_00901 [Fructobacillus tropaeoli]